MDHRSRARQLAAEYLAKGDATAWFERLYLEAEYGVAQIPWADRRPNPNLTEFWQNHALPSAGKTALIIGCGFGDDAEQVARWGFKTTAFDISESAIRACQRRFPGTDVSYVVADLLTAPQQWIGHFDFVVECYTLQVLPKDLRTQAIRCLTALLREQGYLLIVSRGREEQDSEGQLPWPLTRGELHRFVDLGLQTISFENYVDSESPPVRRFRALYQSRCSADAVSDRSTSRTTLPR